MVFIVSTAIIGVHCDRFLFSFKEWFDDPGSMNFLSHKQFTCYFCTLSMQFPVYGRHFPVEISHFRPIGPTYSNCDLVASSRFLISFRHSMLLWLSEDYISCGFRNISTFTMRRYDSPVCKPFSSQGRVWIAFAGECSFSGICCYRVELLTILSSLLHYSACDRQ